MPGPFSTTSRLLRQRAAPRLIENAGRVAVPFLVNVGRPHVVGLLTLPLNLAVFEPGPFPDHRLGDGVHQIAAVLKRDVTLDDRARGAGFEQNEVAGIGGGSSS